MKALNIIELLKYEAATELDDAQDEILEKFIAELNEQIPPGTPCTYRGKPAVIAACHAYWGYSNSIGVSFDIGNGPYVDEDEIELVSF